MAAGALVIAIASSPGSAPDSAPLDALLVARGVPGAEGSGMLSAWHINSSACVEPVISVERGGEVTSATTKILNGQSPSSLLTENGVSESPMTGESGKESAIVGASVILERKSARTDCSQRCGGERSSEDSVRFADLRKLKATTRTTTSPMKFAGFVENTIENCLDSGAAGDGSGVAQAGRAPARDSRCSTCLSYAGAVSGRARSFGPRTRGVRPLRSGITGRDLPPPGSRA